MDDVDTVNIIHKNWDEMSKEDFDRIASCGYVMASYRKPEFEAEDAFTSLYYMNVKMTEKELNATKNEITIRPLHVGQEVLIVIGEELHEEKIKSYLKI